MDQPSQLSQTDPEYSNSIINSLKRLERIGSESSKTTEKLKLACFEVAERIETILRHMGSDAPSRKTEPCFDLPRGYMLLYWAQSPIPGFFVPDSAPGGGDDLLDASLGFTRAAALTFAHDIATGLLEDIRNWLEKRQGEDYGAIGKLEGALAVLEGESA